MTQKKPPKAVAPEIRITKAIESWQKDPTQKLSKLAVEFDVPTSSLYARTRGRKTRVQGSEPQKHFTIEEEDVLAD